MLKDTPTPSERRAQGSTLPWGTPALLSYLLFLTVAVAGCGGGSPDSAGVGRSATTEPGSIAEPEPQPTRHAVLGGVASEPTAMPVATVYWSEVMPSSGSDEDGREVNAGFASVSAGHRHTCGVGTDGGVTR